MLQIKGKIEQEMKNVLKREMQAAMLKIKSPGSSLKSPVLQTSSAENNFATDRDKHVDKLIDIKDEEHVADGETQPGKQDAAGIEYDVGTP